MSGQGWLVLLFAVAVGLGFASGARGQEAFAPPAAGDLQPPVIAEKCPTPETWWENLSFFAGLEASREPQDLGINANFGGNLSANLGFPLLPDIGLGGQVGTGVNLEHAGVKVLRVIEGTRDREQWFTTAGLFQRSSPWHWGAAFDLEVSSYYNQFTTGQVRGEAGVQATDRDDVGLWGTASVFGDSGRLLEVDLHVEPISQLSLYWRHEWESQAMTRIWLGLAESHGTDIIILPDRHLSGVVVTFGLEVFVPLNDYFVLFGQGNFITPSDTGTLDAYLGLAFYPGGGARRASSNRFAPVQAVANNPTMALDLQRR